jgi:uncharacterized spore protein YtfJ
MFTREIMDAQQILIGTQDALTARRVFGEPVRVNDTTIIPAAVVRGGGGAGGSGAQQGGGVGFGLNARPAGVYVVRDGDVSWHPAIDVNRIVLGGQLVAIAALLALRPLLLRWVQHRLLPAGERV